MKKFFLLFFLPFICSCAAPKNTSSTFTKSRPLSSGAGPVIVLDAGHGGKNLGTRAKYPYLEEKKVTLSTTLLVRKYLEHLGYKVVLTRNSDVFIPLSRRVHLANHSRSSLFVSIHYNSAPSTSASGIEVFYCDCKKDPLRARESKKLASLLLSSLIHRTKSKSRGVKKGNYYVIRESKIPAVLIEGGFISNQEERKKLRDKNYLEKLAKAIATGIDQYVKS